jgi:hypothetical protein
VALKQLILAALDDHYVSTLQHHCLRFAQVTIEALLAHLNNTYSEITPEVLEQNRSNIMAEWNPDDGIEMIFMCITAACQFAEAAGAANVISEATAIYLALTAIKNTGVLIEPCSDWHKLPAGEQSLANFVFDFTHAWKEHDHCIVATTAGYQALLTTHTDDKENNFPSALPSKNKPNNVIDTVEMFYCWSHGLGFNLKHTSHTCNTKRMATKMMLPFIIAREEALLLGRAIVKNEKDGSHWMSLLNIKILSNLNSSQHTDGPPYISYYSVTADSAATEHFFTIEAPITNRRETKHPIKIRAANGGILEFTHVGEISLPQLPPQARHVHIVPGLASMLLLAMGPLCDARYTIKFDATTVRV